MRLRLILALLAAVMAAAGCGSSADDADLQQQSTSEEQRLANAKASAVEALSPPTWQVAVDTALGDDVDTNTLAACAPDAGFDLTGIDDVTRGYAEVAMSGAATAAPAPDPAEGEGDDSAPPAGATQTFDASVQVRVFDSETAATAAYTALLAVLDSDAGRQCLAERIEQSFGDTLPSGSTVDVAAEEFPGADAAVAVTIVVQAEGLSGEVNVDFVARRDGACTVVATYLGLDGEFPADLARRLFAAAVSAVPDEG